ncbi:MAG: TIR domain-containing protein [Armatimonadetes bacterium]|nr:TIR domain-containing protein [Anaerolineae bacterium]
MQTFISYQRQDQSFAEQLRDALRAWGFRTWMDIEDIPKGAYWPDEIDRGLQNCEVIVGVISPNAVASRNVRNEWDWALTNGKRLLLVLRQPTALPHRYVSVNYIDFAHSDALAQLKAALTDTAHPQYRDDTSPARIQVTQAAAPATQATADQNRARLLSKVSEFWVQGVLDNALRENAFALGLQLAPDAVLQHMQYGDHALPTSADIYTIFEDLGRELLILGAPGAGKTVVMLQLARELLKRAGNDPAQPIPVVLNLSSWAQQRPALAEWLVWRLHTEYRVPPKVGQRWVEDEALLPLLDGLDEVKLEHREACILAINAFREQHRTVDVVVCSRIADYEILAQRLNLQGALCLQPLNPSQVEARLNQPEFDALRTALAVEPWLREMATTPFLLNTMTYTYHRATPGEVERMPDEAARRTRLFDRYVKLRCAAKPMPDYSMARTRKYLVWLATHMQARKLSVFHIEDLGFDWLDDDWERRLYRPGGTLIGAVIGGLCGALAGFCNGWLVDIPREGLLVGSVIGMVLGALIGATQTASEQIRIAERLAWVFSIRGIFYAVITGLIIGIVTWWVGALSLGGEIGIIGGSVSGVIAITSVMLAAGIRRSEQVESRNRPNRGIRQSAINGVTLGVISGVISVLAGGMVYFGLAGLVALPNSPIAVEMARAVAFGLKDGTAKSIASGIGFGLAVGIACGITFGGGDAVIKHVLLRGFLYRRGRIPVHYAHFLDTCTQWGILRRVGGGYIFVHRMLLEYFVSLAATKPTDSL